MRPNRPHIPSLLISFKERGHKTCSTPELLAYLPSCLQIVVTVVFAAAFRRFRSAFPLLFRFGEGAFTHPPRNPQEENDSRMTKFSSPLEFPRNPLFFLAV
jgi:hypothetical protein